MSEDHEKNETNQIEIYFQLKCCLPLQKISREKRGYREYQTRYISNLKQNIKKKKKKVKGKRKIQNLKEPSPPSSFLAR